MFSLNRTKGLSLALSLVGHALFLISWWTIQPERHETTIYSLSYGEAHLSGPSGEAGKPKASKPKPLPTPKITTAPTVTPNTVASDSDVVTTDGSATSNSGSGAAGVGDGTGGGHGNSLSARARYNSQVLRLLEENKRYPRSARTLRQEGEVVVALKLAKDGKLLDVKLQEESRFMKLNEASLETVKSVEKFPPIPDELGLEEISFTVPIRFSVKM